MSEGLDRAGVQQIVNGMLPKMEILVDKKIERLESNRDDGMGCQSTLGCVKGNKHFQWHEDKLNSDIEDFVGFKKEQEEENKLMGQKLSDVAGHMVVAASNMSKQSEAFTELKTDYKEYKKEVKKDIADDFKPIHKRVDKYEGRFWWMVGIIVGASLMAVWRIDVGVSKGSIIEESTQRTTKAFITLAVADFTNQPVEAVMDRYDRIAAKAKTVSKKKEKIIWSPYLLK